MSISSAWSTRRNDASKSLGLTHGTVPHRADRYADQGMPVAPAAPPMAAELQQISQGTGNSMIAPTIDSRRPR